jgi:adenine-specific DNA-methyltransferase
MKKLLDELKDVLKEDERFFTNDTLLKNKAIERALDNDEQLLELLLSNERLKEHFFTEAGEHLVFDEEKFVQFVSNKQFLPNSYTAFKNKVGLKQGNEYLQEKNDIELVWPYKDCVLEGGQTKEDEGREEKFYNKTLAPDQVDKLLDPKVLTNFKRYTQDGEEELKEISEDDNLFIRGNNLLALNSLKERYGGEVRLIYLDPPYYFSSRKSGDSFSYNTNFKLSTWLTFMKTRLKIARELLTEDGALFIQINDEAVAELQILLKEVFNRRDKDNSINMITVETKSPSGFASVNPGVFETAEYILSFAKDKDEWEYTEQYVESEYDENYRWFIPNKDENYKDWQIKNLFEYVAKNKGYENKEDAVSQLGEVAFYEIVGDFAKEHADQVFQSTAISDAASKKTVEVREESKDHPEKIFHVPREDYYDIRSCEAHC